MLKIVKAYDGRIASSICSVGTAVRDVISRLKANYSSMNDCTLFELTVILNELLLNAIKHGNHEDESKHVKITAGVTERGFACFIVEDEGCGYDYKNICVKKQQELAETELCDMMESGRGILIINNLCDSVRVNTKGNKIVILKKLK